jgi:hypothetical protein
MVQTFTDLLEAILKIKVALDSPPSVDKFKARLQELQEIAGQKGLAPFQKEMVENQIKTLQERIGEQYPEAPTQIKEWVAGWTPKKKAEAPGLPGAEDLKVKKEWFESLSKNAEMMERMSFPGFEAFWVDLKEGKEDADRLLEAFVKANAKIDEGNIQELLDQYDQFGDTLETISERLEYSKLIHQEWLEEYSKVSKLEQAWEDFGQSIADNFNTMFVDVMTGGFKNVADVFKKFCNSLLNSFVSAIGKMIVEWALFETTTTAGKTSKSFLGSGSGLGVAVNWIGGLLGLQHGGVFTSPTPALIGEAGPEAVIPLKGGKIPIEGGKKGDTYVTYIEATDVDSFSRKYGSVIEGIYFKGKRFNKMSMR